MPDNKKQGRSNKTMTFFVCFLAALAGLLFGLDIGVIAGALPFIANEFQISAHTQEWVVSSMMFGAAVGAVDAEEWKAEIPQIEEWFAKFGDQLPVQLQVELDGLKERLGA